MKEGGGERLYASLLRFCTDSKDLSLGRRLHVRITLHHPNSTYLANLLICMYARGGSLPEARSAFDAIPPPLRDGFSWNLVIAAHARHGQPREALSLYKDMVDSSRTELLSGFTFRPILSAVTALKSLAEGKKIHEQISTAACGDCGYSSDVSVMNSLLTMYGKCGSVDDARSVFDAIHPQKRNVVSWNAMISIYSVAGFERVALELLSQMISEGGLKPNSISFLSLLSPSSPLGLNPPRGGPRIHAWIVAYGLELDLLIQNALLSMYGRCGSVEIARYIFNRIPIYQRNTISWNAMMSVYAHNGYFKEALRLYPDMEKGEVKPNNVTFVCLLHACAKLGCIETARATHKYILASGLELDIASNNAIIDMYGKCGSLEDSRLAFDEMRQRDSISWNAMIAVYAQFGHGKEAVELFRQMEIEGVKPNNVTFLCLLNACASIPSLEDGREAHRRIKSTEFEADMTVKTALVNMYGKCGSTEDARIVFDGMHWRDVISWNAMLTAYAQNGHGEEALKIFKKMEKEEGIKPDKVTFLCLIDALNSIPSLEHAKAIHKCIVCSGFESDATIKNALVNMYGKCGSLRDAISIFDSMHHRGVISWSAILSAYSQNGRVAEAVELFRRMDSEGLKPDRVAFLCLLQACSYAGLWEEGWQFFIAMGVDYNATPAQEHYRCLIDLLGRAGCLRESEATIENMPIHTDAEEWITLLSACRIRGNVDGQYVAFGS